MPNYAHLLFGYYLNMLLLVLQCTLHLPVFTRGSKVLDAYNQAVQKNKYCSQIAECLPGTHVMCMYGNTEVMSPRCADGRILPLDATERTLFLDIFNGFRRDLASGKEILGKDGIRLPQARNMRKLFWDNDLATFAQAWANQCHVRRNQCHSTDHYPRAGQMVGIVRFSYPDWSVPNQKFVDAGLSLERRKFAIEDFAKTVFSARKDATLNMTQKHVGSGHGNVYLMSVYGSTSHIGCAMTTFVDYQMSFKSNNDYYNALILVCNFGSRPQIDEPIYMTNGTGPCSCFTGFKLDNCLCISGEDLNNRESNTINNTEKPDHKEENTEKNDKKEDKTEKPDQKEEKTVEPNKNGDEGSCPEVAPVVMVLPILDVHDAGLMQQLHPFQNKNSTTIAQRKQQFRNKIKKRIQNAKDQDFCNHGEPIPPIFDARPVNQDSLLKSKFDPDNKKSNGHRKERDLDLTIPRDLHNIRIKPKLDISDMNAHILHNHQNIIKGNSRTNMAHQLFNDMRNTAATKVYVTSGKSIKYPFENLQRTQRLNRPLPYGVQGFSNQVPNVFISSINGKPIKFHYDDEFKKSQQPSIRDLSYDDKGFKYKTSPYMAISNVNHDQLFSDLYAEEQELEDMWYNSYIDEIVQKILHRTEEKITNIDNILINKETGKDDLTKTIGSKVYATDYIDPTNIDKEEKIVKTKIDVRPTRNKMMHNNLNHNEINSLTQEANRIFNDMTNSAAANLYVTTVNDKPVKYPFENIQKPQELNTKTLPYHAESEIYITSINGEPKKFKHLQNPVPRILSYDVQDLNDKISPYAIPNDNREQLLSGLFSQVQELKEILYNTYMKEIDRKNFRTTGEDITNNDNILITKQIDDLTDKTSSKVLATNINDPTNIDNEQKTMEIGNWPIKNQNLNGGNSQTEEENRIFKDMRNSAATKVYVTFVNDNPVKYPFEKSLRLNTKNMLPGEQSTSNQEPKIDIINGNCKPVKNNYGEIFKKSKYSAARDLSYDTRGSIYKKSPYKTKPNDNLDQLLIDLYNEEQELKDILFKAYIDEMEKENLPGTGKKNTNKDIILTNKQSRKGANVIASKVFPVDNNNHFNIDNEQKTIKTHIDDWPKRNQVPLHIHAYGTDNFDYYKHFHATKEFIKPRATLRKKENKNDQNNAKDASNEYSPEKNRYDYDVDKLRNI